MKKVKQIIAILGIIIILACFGTFAFSAATASADNMNIFFASIVMVVMVPVLMWIYLFIYRMTKKNKEENQEMDFEENGF